MARQIPKEDASQVLVEAQRLDKWLWFARVAKTRTIAAGLVSQGRVRVNRVRTTKPAQSVKIGDVVTVSVGGGVRVLKIQQAGQRRGPATEAAILFEEIVPLQTRSRSSASMAVTATDQKSDAGQDGGSGRDQSLDELAGPGQGGPVAEAGSGRPTKRDRRVLDRLRSLGDD